MNTPLRFDRVFSEHMVLQRDMRVPVWGTGPEGAEIEVRLAAQAAIDTGHENTRDAQTLRDEAARAEQAAQAWLDSDLKLMEASLFAEATMNLRERMLSLPLAERIEFDARSKTLFVNFEGLVVDSAQDIDEIETEVARCIAPLGIRVGEDKRLLNAGNWHGNDSAWRMASWRPWP